MVIKDYFCVVNKNHDIMRRFTVQSLFVAFLLLFCLPLYAQELTVKSFVLVPDDATARDEKYQRVDDNGTLAGLVKVVIPRDDVEFDGDMVLDQRKWAMGEYWVWMADGATKLAVRAPGFQVLELDFSHYEFKMLQSKKTYKLVIVVPSLGTHAQEHQSGALRVNYLPIGGDVYVDGSKIGTNPGTFFNVKVGSHKVEIRKEGYISETRTVEVREDQTSELSGNLRVLSSPDGSIKTFTVKGVSFNMVSVEGGTFQMGATEEQGVDAGDEEKPVHSVTLDSYMIGQTEVTQELWEAVMGTTVRQQRDKESSGNYLRGEGKNYPMYYISWIECKEFIEKLNQLTKHNFRLPTEAEWEFASRGGNRSGHYKYSGSKNIKDVAWYVDNSKDSTHPVGTKKANQLGIYDMSGNVIEWCEDKYEEDYYSHSPQMNPEGPNYSDYRVLRGGSLFSDAWTCRVSCRLRSVPSLRGTIGFRLACGQQIENLKEEDTSEAKTDAMRENETTSLSDSMTAVNANHSNNSTSTVLPKTNTEAEEMNNQGEDYYYGRNGKPEDYSEAVKWYRKAAELGSADGQFNLGYMYENGEGVEKDYSESAKWYRKAAEQGHADGQFNLGCMYINGNGVPQYNSDAMKWFLKAAEQGHSAAQFNIGVMYANGIGVPQDNSEAVKWYRKAAELGYAEGQFNLGFMYDMGYGVTENNSEAVKWYRKAAEQGLAEAQFNLGYMYELGEGVKKDFTQAKNWYEKAAAQGHEKAENGLRRVLYLLQGAPTAVIGNVQTFTVKGVSFNMISIEGGSFQMGATSEQKKDADNDEKPVHNVTLNDFMIGETEVTQELWEVVMGTNPSSFKDAKHPVECVSWNDCMKFISALRFLTGRSFRLPTEAEWEFAARGGNKSGKTVYSGSDTIDNVAWYDDNSGNGTHPVGTKKPNELGIYDMSGNVDEWCEDRYGSYSSSPQTNPQGSKEGSLRVVRGGSWHSLARHCRVSVRGSLTQGNLDNKTVGFRLSL